MNEGIKQPTLGCMDATRATNPLLIPLLMPMLVLNSFMMALSNSFTQVQQNPFGAMNPMSTFMPMGSMGTNTVVDVTYNAEGDIVSIHDRTW